MSSAEELRQAVRAALDDPDGVLADIRAELRLARQASSDGRPFTMPAGAAADGTGQAIVQLGGPGIGEVWHLERVGFVCPGANAAGVAVLYLDSPQADVDILDLLGSLQGNNPSRGVFAAPGAPYLIPNGTPALIVITGLVAGTQVSARMQGRAVEVETSGGRV